MIKKALILGGTGAMGAHVVQILANKGFEVYVTSRSSRIDKENIYYIKGNAKNIEFVSELCNKHKWDAIIDFMVYTLEELAGRTELFLKNSNQYIFISSARVYADANVITEECPRLLDVINDREYLSTNEYALIKAREENIIITSKYSNWTIVRPSLTYAENRLQLGAYEKENWLRRALLGKTIVFSRDLMDKYYTLSYGKDVAEGIASIVGRNEALEQVYNIVSNESFQWSEILNIYLEEIYKVTGIKPKVVLTDKCTNLAIPFECYQVIYGRYYNRHFDNSKIKRFVNTETWLTPREGLAKCIEKFLQNPVFGDVDWRKEALIDKAAHEWTPIWKIPGKRAKIRYIKWRLFGHIQ